MLLLVSTWTSRPSEDGRLLALDLPDEVLEELEALVGPVDGHLFGLLGLCG